MTATLFVLTAMLIAVMAIARFSRRNAPMARVAARVPRANPAAAAPRQGPVSLSRAPPPPLQMLEWIDAPPPLTIGAAQARVRDRYIAARFPGFMTCAADLGNVARAIEAARLYFDERKFDRAHEVLQLAIEVSPREPGLRLAQLEIAFLKRDPARFLDAAHLLRAAIPELVEWKEVQRLGRALLPDEKLFGSKSARRESEHYGPWPDMPNWIGASWDLTAEVRAADFHQAMRRTAGHSIPAHLRTAA